ncbi:hypothetical protein L6164_020508 [Bauhinia variegata]|uniref:Uncharacterized protein n=1 Tax=Bauhinia variegata TaxID=167791 RepID=A0ACB9MWX2_BAUVA|nr:hypothetical protein L6164_020508 [Bauhinia variegata]
METGSESLGRIQTLRNDKRNGSVPVNAKVEPFVARTDHNPRELRSWAKRTGFVSDYSGEAGSSASEKYDSVGFELERGLLDQRGGGSSPKIEIDPVLGRTRPNRGNEIEPAAGPTHGSIRHQNNGGFSLRDGTVGSENQERRNGNEQVLGSKDEKSNGFKGNGNANGIVNGDSNGRGIAAVAPVPEQRKEDDIPERDVKVNVYPEGEEPADGDWQRPSQLNCGLRENPGFGQLNNLKFHSFCRL